MIVYDTIAAVPEHAKDAVIAIGNFDGVHRGHRALIETALREASRLGDKSVGVLTFEPHPRTLFRPDDPPFRITPPALKHDLLAALGVDFIVSLPFDWAFASQSAEDFVRNVLQDSLAPAHVVIGEDFGFGQLRKGSAQTIAASGIPVTALSPVTDAGGGKYSSTVVREALRAGDIATANGILGWDWEMLGPVFRGDRRGHELGYPTANVLMTETLHPAYGVYAGLVNIEGEIEWRPSAINIGIRPMFELKQGQIEAHILDMEDRDLYDRIVRVRPVKRLRGEAKFSSLEGLIAQMDEDCRQARRILTAD